MGSLSNARPKGRPCGRGTHHKSGEKARESTRECGKGPAHGASSADDGRPPRVSGGQQHRTAPHGTAPHGTARHRMARHGTAPESHPPSAHPLSAAQLLHSGTRRCPQRIPVPQMPSFAPASVAPPPPTPPPLSLAPCPHVPRAVPPDKPQRRRAGSIDARRSLSTGASPTKRKGSAALRSISPSFQDKALGPTPPYGTALPDPSTQDAALDGSLYSLPDSVPEAVDGALVRFVTVSVPRCTPASRVRVANGPCRGVSPPMRTTPAPTRVHSRLLTFA